MSPSFHIHYQSTDYPDAVLVPIRIEADDLFDANILAKYRIREGGAGEYKVLQVVMATKVKRRIKKVTKKERTTDEKRNRSNIPGIDPYDWLGKYCNSRTVPRV
jgi:hypothetical protein